LSKTLILKKSKKFLSLDKSLEKIKICEEVQAVFVIDPTKIHLTEIKIAKNSSLHLLYFCNRIFEKNWNVNTKIFLKDNAQSNITQIYFGTKNTSINFEVFLNGKNSVSNIYAVYFADKSQNCDFQIANNFIGQGNEGEVLIKGIVCDQAKVKVDGQIKISKKAHETKAMLIENSLMLNETAEITHLPVLRINTNDVRASHAASITRLNEEDLFYLKSRGLKENLSKQLLIDAFLSTTFTKDKTFERYFCKINKKVLEKFENNSII